MYTANSNWDYTKRQFDALPAGFRANSEAISAVPGSLNVNAGTFIQAGLGLALSSITAPDGIRYFNLPTGSSTAADFGGILFYDETLFRFPGQTPFTHTKDDLVTVVRGGGMRVLKVGAIASINSPVFWVHTASGLELPGMFKTSAGSPVNAVQLKNVRWAETSAGTGVGAVTLELLPTFN